MSEILTALASVATAYPDKTAIVGEKYTLSYRTLLYEIEKIAGELSPYRGHVVALLADNGPEWLIIDLAAQQAGVVLLPLPIYFTSAQIQHAMQSAGAQAVIYSPNTLPAELINHLANKPKAFANYPLQHIHCPFATHVELPEGTDKITFTSGSTGTPKGVCLSNHQQFNVAKSLLKVTDLQSPRHLAVLPLSTLLENIAGGYAPLLAGGEVVLLPLEKSGYPAGYTHFLQLVSHVRPETMILVPELLSGMLNGVSGGWHPPASLKFIAVGGSRVAGDLVHRSRSSGLPVFEGYGLSEAGSVVSLNTPKADKPGSAGKVLPHLDVTTEHGEVVIQGSQFLGYINHHKKPAEKLFTGDLGSLDASGFLSIEGRKKQILISSYGRNINPEWIESEVLANPAVQQCVVVGDARPYCSALIYSTLDDPELQNHLDLTNEKLPPYARVLRWHRLQQPLSQERGQLTGNGRPKRAAINLSYQDIINALYQEEADGILCHTAN